MNPRRLRAYSFLIIVAAIWGSAGPVIKYTLQGIDPLPFLAYRFAIAGLFAVVYFLIKGFKVPKPRTNLPKMSIYGVLAFTIALLALFVGLDQSTVLNLTIVAAAGPLLVTLGGAIFFKDHITHRERVGISIVIIGVFLATIIPLISSGMSFQISGTHFLLLFLISDIAAVLLAKRLMQKKVDSFTLANFGLIIAAITIIPLAIFTQGWTNLIQSVTQLPVQLHLGVWYMALISGTLAYYLSLSGYKSIEVSEAALFTYVQPLFAIPLAIIWLGESITTTFIVGGSLIATGIVIAEYKRSWRSKKRGRNNRHNLV